MLKSKRFIRKIEDFVCNYCGLEVKGDGYTDHCPHCLYSKHVDNNPGDRKCSCGGLMEPMGVIIKGGKQMIYYRCLKCSYHHRVKISPHDVSLRPQASCVGRKAYRALRQKDKR